jgi:methylated-DNA-[protein]-cysteine S-methyltransferase
MPVESSTDRVIRWHSFEASIGRIYVASSGRGLCRLTWHVSGSADFLQELVQRFPSHGVTRDAQAADETAREIQEYFAGRRRRFDIDLDLSALSDFERDVLEETRRVPFGATASYSELARRIGRPRSARAVGNALRRNPVPILVPCHRIVRQDGTPGGYGGPRGSEEKSRLLQLESAARRHN